MNVNLVVVADTHLPLRARALPDAVWAAVEAADVVVHAGDWVSEALLDEFEARSRRLVAVHGNNDGPGLQARLPAVARVELEGVRIAVVHQTGPAKDREIRCARDYPGTDVLFFGHSHIPWDSTAPGGLRLLNPGSPTDRRRQPFCTYLTATITTGDTSGAVTTSGAVDPEDPVDDVHDRRLDVVLHHLPLRNQPPPRTPGG